MRAYMRRHSILIKLTSILVVLIGSTILLAWVLNWFMGEDYYIKREKENIVKQYYKVNKIFNEEDADYFEELQEIERNCNTKIIVSSTNSLYGMNIIYSTMGENSKGYQTLRDYLQEIQNYAIFGGADATSNIVKEIQEKGYVIRDKSGMSEKKEDIVLFGQLDCGYTVAMRIPLESISSSVKIASAFLAKVGIWVTILGSIGIFFVSKSFTKPIEEMARAAKKMTELDFNVKVTNLTNDELGDLGRDINDLASKLEDTISDLKTANNELRKDIDRKIEIDNMRKEFLSHVSHELKTPIALIQGYAEGLKENITDDEESKEFYCEVICDEAQKMNNMIKKLLMLNQIEFGNEQVKMQRFNITDMVTNLLASSSILFEKKNVTLLFDETEEIDVWADEFMIEEVFTNYVSNALNHVTEGGAIQVRFEKMDLPSEQPRAKKEQNETTNLKMIEDISSQSKATTQVAKQGEISQKGDTQLAVTPARVDRVVRIFVRNTGKQIPEEDLEKIWIRFFKVDKARTREYGGSGIGLSIVATTMQAHGRKFGVRNCPDGVEFYFDLERA